jgi:hypothetical protein
MACGFDGALSMIEIVPLHRVFFPSGNVVLIQHRPADDAATGQHDRIACGRPSHLLPAPGWSAAS